MKMSRDQLEYAISQSIDGTLDPLAQAALDEALATHADARDLFAEYQRLDAMVKSEMPVPEINWDAFAAGISSEAAKLDAPVKHYKLNFGMWSKVAALAAMVAIVVGVIVRQRPTGSVDEIGTGSSVAVNTQPIDVEISAPPTLASAPVSEIQIGQPSGVAFADYHSTDAVISAPSSIWIASGDAPAQDTADPASLY